MQKKINCSQCKKYLFDADTNRSMIHQAQEKGFIGKIPFLFNNSSDILFFCDKKCGKTYFDLNFSKEIQENAKKIIDEIKEEMPKAVEELTSHIHEVSKILFKKNKNC